MQLVPMFLVVPMAAAILIILTARKLPRLGDALANLATLALLLMAISVLGKDGVYWIKGLAPSGGTPIGINLVLDKSSILMLTTVALIAFMVTLYSIPYMGRRAFKAHFYSLFLVMIAGVNGVALTGDLLSLYVFIEISSLASYALVAFGDRQAELEASFRYLVVGSVGSLLILLALAVTYSLVGSLNMAQVAKTFGPSPKPIHLVAAGLFVGGFGLKSAFFPFHMWLVDASRAASAPVAAALSGIVIEVVGIFAMARVLFNAIGMTGSLHTLLMILGTISILVGALMALREDDIKRVLAYHSVSEVGFIVLALGVGTRPAIAAALVYIVTHAIYKALLFLNAGAMEYATGSRDLAKLGGLKHRMPVTGATSVIGALSISAIPPFGGFWARFFIIVAVVQAERYGYAAWAVAGSILTLASFARFQKRVCHDQVAEACAAAKEVPVLMQVSMIGLAVLCIVAGLLWLPQVQDGFFMPAAKIIQEGITYGSSILGM
jgi:multicomponent Na+:H+ antiporter subunit D